MSIIIIALKFSRSFTQNNKKQNAANTRENMDVQQRTNKRSLRAPAWCEKLFCATKKKYIYRYILIRVRNLWCTKYNSQREEKEKKVRKKKPRKRPKYLSKRQTWQLCGKDATKKKRSFTQNPRFIPKRTKMKKNVSLPLKTKQGAVLLFPPQQFWTIIWHEEGERER